MGLGHELSGGVDLLGVKDWTMVVSDTVSVA